MLKKISYLLCFIFCVNASVFAQETYNNLKKGIQLLEKENFPDAEASFKKIIEQNDTIKEAFYNLGNAVYAQERYEEARENYNKALSFFTDKKDIAETHHNIGNTFMAEKKWEESIKSFKNALKNNSADMDTKYNLAYAQKMLEKQQQQEQQNQDQENQDENKDEKKEENQDEGDKDDKKKDEQGDREEDDKDGEKKDEKEDEGDKEKEEQKEKEDSEKSDEEKKEETQEAQPEEMKLTKEEAERLLRAIEMQEEKLQDKKKQEDMTPVRINTEKDW